MVNFFSKTLKYCIQHEKDKRVDKLELIFDILRRFLVRKQPNILKLFDNEFINLLNALGNCISFNFCTNFHVNVCLDFEDEKINQKCKKKLLELVYFIPKINNYLFTKLAIHGNCIYCLTYAGG